MAIQKALDWKKEKKKENKEKSQTCNVNSDSVRLF